MLKKIACISIVILLVGALSLPCFAFTAPTYDEDTSQLIYYVEGPDDLFYVKNKNSYFLYNPTDSVLTMRITLTNYFMYYSRFYIITSYSWANNNSCTIQYSSKFSDTTTFTFTDFIGGDFQSDFVSFIGSINPDGSDNVDFDSLEVFADISVNPGKVCAFQFSWNRAPQPNDDGPGFDPAVMMDETGLMAYTAALYDISRDFYGSGEGSDFDFFNLFNQIGSFTKLQGYNSGYNEGITDGYNQGSFIGDEKFNEGYNKGFSDGYPPGYLDGYDEGFKEGVNEVITDDPKFSGIKTFQEAYNLGYNNGSDSVKGNKNLPSLVRSIFGGLFDSIFSFIDNLGSKDSAFGVDISTMFTTILGVGVMVAIFSFVVGKIS